METNSDILLPKISEEDFPVYISSQVDELSKLQKDIESSDESAKKAMKFVSEKMTRYQVKGKWIFKYRSGNTKDIIEDTQVAIEKLAQAQQVSVEALKQSFDFQKKLAETSKKLFLMGCCNLTMNRITVRSITEKLSGASKEELSELAKQELISVVRQLKAQEDMLIRQEKLEKISKENTRRLDKKDKIDEEQTQHLQKIAISLEEKSKIDKKQEEMISNNKLEIDKINIDLIEKDKVDEQQTKHLNEIAVKLKEKDNVDKKQEELISENKSEINKIKQLYHQQSIQINKIEGIIISSNKNMKENYNELYKNQLKEIKSLGKKTNKILIVVTILFIVLISINLLMLCYKL
jgi:hypothetical protein